MQNGDLNTLFEAPICPHCATIYDPVHYDVTDDCARCPNCGTAYHIDDAHRPAEPDPQPEARIVASHEPRYWTAQATGFRLIRLLEKYMTLTRLCWHAASVSNTATERDFFRQEYDRVHGIGNRIAHQARHSNAYTILSAQSEYSPAYHVVVKRWPILLAADSRLEETPLFVDLEQFRVDVQEIAAREMRATAGASYELYARLCGWFISNLHPQIQRLAVAIANYHGYIEDEDERYADFGPGYCSLTGIEEYCCPCGRHP